MNNLMKDEVLNRLQDDFMKDCSKEHIKNTREEAFKNIDTLLRGLFSLREEVEDLHDSFVEQLHNLRESIKEEEAIKKNKSIEEKQGNLVKDEDSMHRKYFRKIVEVQKSGGRVLEITMPREDEVKIYEELLNEGQLPDPDREDLQMLYGIPVKVKEPGGGDEPGLVVKMYR